MSSDSTRIRKELVTYGRLIAHHGLVIGPGGNSSARSGNTVYVKASGISFEDATERDYIGVDLRTGKVVEGKGRPTCEIWMHLYCYHVRPDVGAVIHTHAPLSTAVATSRWQLRAMSPDFVTLVGSRVAKIKYFVPSGMELARAIRKAVRDHNAVLMENHGSLAAGSHLKEAYYRVLHLEEASRTLIAAKVLGKVKVFTPAEIEAINKLDAVRYRRGLLKGTKDGCRSHREAPG